MLEGGIDMDAMGDAAGAVAEAVPGVTVAGASADAVGAPAPLLEPPQALTTTASANPPVTRRYEDLRVMAGSGARAAPAEGGDPLTYGPSAQRVQPGSWIAEPSPTEPYRSSIRRTL